MPLGLNEIVIASYLHDIGKFAQRAGIQELCDGTLAGQICKLQKGGWYSHQHALYSYGFLEKYRNVLPDGLDTAVIKNLAACHHSPSNYAEWIISQGDRLSSGADRCNLMNTENRQDGDNPAKFYEKPMLHILSTVHISERRKAPDAFCQMRPLEDDAVLASAKQKIGQEDYRKLWDAFVSDFQNMQGLMISDFLEALDSLLEQYWWCIPSATNTDADISLYQHAKTTAAFASALFLYHQAAGAETEQALGDNAEKKFRFVKGDVSGIQNYIFDLKSTKNSTKLLRAKSFQIASLGEILSSYIVRQFGLSKANILTSAGGNFMLLLPNTKDVKEKLEKIQLEIEEYFLREFAGKLAVILSDGVEASACDVGKENALQLINAIGRDGDIAKQKKMQKALQKNGPLLSDLYSGLQQYGECAQCGIFPAEPEDADGNPKPCRNCGKLSEIGRDLVKTSYLKMESEKLVHFGQMVHIRRNDPGNGWHTINRFAAGHPVAYMPYTAPWKNEENGELLTFEEIAQKSTGNKKIAMFKADIDNLGLIFSSGLGKRMSFSRYADMSCMMHTFFSFYYTWFVNHHGYFSSAAGKNILYKDVIYTVFSGGDDLCILGAWDAVMAFAGDFEREVSKLTAGNDSVHISGGIVLSSSNVPVKHIAEAAEEALDASKERKENGRIVKNAVTVFGTTVSWEDYRKLLQDGRQLEEYLKPGENGNARLSAAVVYKLLDFANRAQAVDRGDIHTHNLLWQSHMHYLIARNVKDTSIRDWLLSFGTNKEKIIQSRIAVSYGLYTQRNN